jgi:hypothetical protein
VAISYLVPGPMVRRESVALADEVTGGCWRKQDNMRSKEGQGRAFWRTYLRFVSTGLSVPTHPTARFGICLGQHWGRGGRYGSRLSASPICLTNAEHRAA